MSLLPANINAGTLIPFNIAVASYLNIPNIPLAVTPTGDEALRNTKPILNFNNGKDALDHFKSVGASQDLPEIFFVDIKMYTMDGWDFLLEFRKIKPMLKKPIDIYMISNSSMRKDMEKASSLHVTGYLVIPIPINMLKNILQ